MALTAFDRLVLARLGHMKQQLAVAFVRLAQSLTQQVLVS
jgi:hypothetical protein